MSQIATIQTHFICLCMIIRMVVKRTLSAIGNIIIHLFSLQKNISFLDIWNNFSRNDLRLHIHSMIKQYVIVLY